MRKIASLFAVAALAGGGVMAVSGSSATAGEPYPGSINTNCFAEALNNPRVNGNPARVKFRVGTEGNGAANGVAHFAYERKSNAVIVDEFKRTYLGPDAQKYAFEGLPRGRYTVRVWFNSKPGDSVYQNCRTTFSQRIRPRG